MATPNDISQQNKQGGSELAGSDRPLITITTPHLRIHEGVSFGADYYLSSLADDAVLDIVVVVGSKSAHAVPSWSVGGDCEARWFKNTTITSGTEIPSFNRADYSGTPAETKVYRIPVDLVDGDEQSSGGYIPGGSGPLAAGGQRGFDREVVLKAGSTYLFRVINRSGGAIMLSFDMDWYES